MATVNKLDFYLLLLKPVDVLTARVNGAPSDPYMTIDYDAGQTGTATSVGTSGAPVPGNTVWFGTTDGGQERGTVRLRSWTPSDATGTAGSLSIAETDDVGPQISDDDYITIKLDWRLWNITPRLIQRGTEVEFYEDYDIGFTDQTVNWRPVAVAGPPAVEFGRGPVTVSFVGDRSFALAPGATITTYLWTAHGSVEGTSASQGTEGSPVTFTWNSAGQYLVTLKVTDSNGNSHTTYTWVFIVDPSDVSAGSGAYTQFDAYNDSIDFSRGGGECSFTVHGVADVTEFPREAMVVHAANGSQTTPTGTWPFRANTLGVYYVVGNSIRQDSVNNTTSFRAQTIDGLMKNLSMHATSLRDERGPSNWTMASDITVDRAASFQMIWRSTLADMTPIVRMNYSAEIKRQDFAPTNLYAQLQNELVKDAWGQLISSHQSVLHLARDYNLMTTSERTAITTRKTLHKGIWLDPLDIEERQDYAWPVRKVKMSGIRYPGNQAEPVPYFSEAPGDVHKSFGREDAPGRLILTVQADLNTRCGYALARQNTRWHVVRGRFVNDASFTVAPQEIFPANIEATDNNRGLSWTPDLIPRRVRRTYDHNGGYYVSEVEFEPSVTGPAGVTVELPTTPLRTPTIPQYDPAPIPPWTPPITPLAGAAGAADKTLGTYWTNTKGATWERRINGLAIGATGTSQLFFNDLIWDPWWFTESKKASSDPEQSIWWGFGPGFVVKTDDAMKTWDDMTPYITSPATGTVTVDQVTFLQGHADIHHIDTFYALAEWGTGSAWNSGVAKTVDNGKTWEWHDLSNVVTDDDGFIYPLLSKGLFGHPSNGASPGDVLWAESGQGQSSGEADDLFLQMKYYASKAYTPHLPDYRCNIIFDFGAQISGVKTVWVKGYKDGTLSDFFGTRQFTNDAAEWQDAYDNYQTGDWDQFTATQFTAGFLSAAPAANDWYKVLTTNADGREDFRYFDLQTVVRDTWTDGASWFCDTIRVEGTITQKSYRPLAMDLDSQDGTRLYVTMWNQTDETIELWTYNSSTFNRLSASVLGDAATDADITTRTEWAFPHTPHYPGTADFGDYVYVAGRWSYTGTVDHLYLSTDAGVSFSNIGDASWTTERVGGFRPDEEGAGQTLYAFLNGTPAQWRTLDAGASWSSLGSDPFDVEFEAVSRHWGGGGDFLIGNNAAGSVQAAWLASPYTDAWLDATGPAGQRLPTAADGGGGIAAIAWV